MDVSEEKIEKRKEFSKAVDFVLNNFVSIVYFVRCKKYVKIGSTKGCMLINRIKTLQCGNPYEIKFERMLISNKNTERILHKKLEKFHKSGEWFKLEKQQVKNIISDYYKQMDEHEGGN